MGSGDKMLSSAMLRPFRPFLSICCDFIAKGTLKPKLVFYIVCSIYKGNPKAEVLRGFQEQQKEQL